MDNGQWTVNGGRLRWRCAVFSIFLLCTLQCPAEPAAPTCRAIVIAGQPGTPVHARRYRDWVKRFHAYLTTGAGIPAENITILSGDAEFAAPIVSGRAESANVGTHLADLAKTVGEQDQFILVLIGHGSSASKTPKLLLPGRDLDVRALADLLDAIPARNQVILNVTSSSGAAIASFAREGRVVVSATSPLENAEPVFCEFFLRGLESGRADGEGAPDAGVADGRTTLLEAFNWAARETPSWIRRIKKAGSDESWAVMGRESVEIFRKLYVANDGTAGARQLAPGSDASVDDPDVPFTTPKELARELGGVRIIAEHAMLEDSGQELGVAPVRAGKFEALTGRVAGEPGALARRVILGRPGLSE